MANKFSCLFHEGMNENEIRATLIAAGRTLDNRDDILLLCKASEPFVHAENQRKRELSAQGWLL